MAVSIIFTTLDCVGVELNWSTSLYDTGNICDQMEQFKCNEMTKVSPLAAEGSQLTSDLPPAAAQTRRQRVHYLADVGKNDFCSVSALCRL